MEEDPQAVRQREEARERRELYLGIGCGVVALIGVFKLVTEFWAVRSSSNTEHFDWNDPRALRRE